MTLPQQSPQILLLLRRQPDLWIAVFHQQLQNQVRISPVMFLFPGLGCPNLGRMTDLAFDSQLFHEVHKLMNRICLARARRSVEQNPLSRLKLQRL